MNIKLKTSEMLVQKLAFGCGDAQLNAVAEIRLFSKWDDANRACLGQAGAISLLLKLLNDVGVDARVQENAMAALLNMSINTEVKVRMAREPGSFDVVMRLASEGGGSDLKANAAALLYSLVVHDEVRKLICSNDKNSLSETLVGILRDGSARCKAEALKALFVVAKDELTRESLLQESFQLVPLLISLLTVGKVKLTEDCLAVLALLASCITGAKAVMRAPSMIQIVVYLVNSGSPRAQENAASVLLNVCKHDDEAKKVLPLQTLIPALNSLHMGGSERGKDKAESLLRLIGFDSTLSLAVSKEDPNSYILGDPKSSFNSNFRGINTMPLMQPHIIHYSPPHQAASPHGHSHIISPSPSASSSSSAPFSNASWPIKPLSNNKYLNLARNLLHKPRKKSHSSIN